MILEPNVHSHVSQNTIHSLSLFVLTNFSLRELDYDLEYTISAVKIIMALVIAMIAVIITGEKWLVTIIINKQTFIRH